MRKKFTPPTAEEVTAYAASLGKELDGNEFCDFYSMTDWQFPYGKKMVKLLNWKAAVRNWCRTRPNIIGKNWRDAYKQGTSE